MALRGNLRDFSALQMLNLVSVAHKTGTLEIQGDGAHARMAFQDGKLMYAAVDGDDLRLTEVLQRGGKLTDAQSREIEAQATSDNDRELAWLALRAGYASGAEIIRSVRAHILRSVFQVFEWSDGTFVFEANRPSFGDRIAVPIDLANVIIAGSRRLRETRLLREALPNLDLSVQLSRGAGARLRKMRMSLDEWRVISMAGPGSTMRRVAQTAGLSEDQVRRVVYGLLQADLVQLGQPEALPPSSGSSRSDAGRRVRRPAVRRNVILRLIDRIRKL